MTRPAGYVSGSLRVFNSERMDDSSPRLEGWKQIAGHLNKDLRTVQRWERAEGLPVHRQLHRAQGNVFAYPEELDEWMRQRVSRPLPPPADVPRPWWRSRWMLIPAAALLALVCFAVWYRFIRADFSRFQAGDMALVTRINNRTGIPMLDATLRSLLLSETARSGWVRIPGFQALQEATAALGVPPGTVVDPVLGERLARTNPRIKLLIDADVSSDDNNFRISIRICDPVTRACASSPAISAARDRGLPVAARQLVDWMRHRLGDPRPDDNPATEHEPVTTRSRVALKLFNQARDVRRTGTVEEAAVQERLLREAVREDPRFASAWLELSWTVRRQSLDGEEWLAMLAKAHELAASVSVAERLHIDADYYLSRRQYAQSIAARRAYLQLYPNSADALSGLGVACEYAGNYEDAAAAALDNVTRHPNDVRVNHRAAVVFGVWNGDIRRGLEFSSKVTSLGTFDSSLGLPTLTWAEAYPLHALWVDGRYAELRRQLDERVSRLAASQPNHLLADYYATFYWALGRPSGAERSIALDLPLRQPEMRVITAWLAGRSLPRFDGEFIPTNGGTAAIILARSGQLAAARRGRDVFRTAFGRQGELGVINGEILAAEGNTREAVTVLSDALVLLRLASTPVYFLGAERLSTLLDAQGHTAEAIDRLRVAVNARPRTYAETGSAAAFWLRDCRLLERIEARTGHTEEAARLQTLIRQALSEAE